jgi:F-box protein 11
LRDPHIQTTEGKRRVAATANFLSVKRALSISGEIAMSNDVSNATAFLSYVRFNDQHDLDALSNLVTRLEGEIHTVTGDSFKIFQDRRDIQVGQNWLERINQALDSVTLLVAILTPGFFRSEYCLAEMQHFLEREAKIKRNDLIIPIYYVDVPGLNGTDRGPNGLFEIIRSRQFFDWRELRFEPLESEQTRRALNRLAVQIRDALDCFSKSSVPAPPPTQSQTDRQPDQGVQLPRPVEQISQTDHAANQPTGIVEPPTFVVDSFRGPYRSLAAAMSAANAGDRILVRAGTYEEGVVMDKPLEIVGQGKPEEIVVQAVGTNALAFRTTLGRVTNITLRQVGGGDYFAVDISQGRLTVENCRVESDSLAGIAIHGGGTDPIIRNNVIHRCRQSGVVVFDSARGTLDENDISDNDVCGVVIRDGANPVLRGNQIRDNKQGGVQIEHGGLGRIEVNSVFSNRREGIVIKDQANPTVRLNTIYKNVKAGIYVYDHGQGALENNEIYDNQNSGIAIRTEGNPIIQQNRITRNNGKGVWCKDRAMGTVEDNDLRGNNFGAFWKSDDSTTRYGTNRE